MVTGRIPILIVDDSPANLKVARFALESEGYDVRTAADGEETAAILKEFRPRLILMDIQLPGVDGLELTRRLKADPATRQIVVVAVTAYAMKGDREAALRAGCDGYITKPVDPIELPLQVQGYLGHPAPAPPTAAINPVLAPARPAAVASIRKSAPSILIIDDNPSTRKVFRVILENAGYEVVEASDCGTALALLDKRKPGLILQDFVLPDMDGLDLARVIRAKLGDAQTPIICVSGFLSRLDETKALNSEFAQVLVKPIDPFHLLDVVKLYLSMPSPDEEMVGEGRLLLVVDDDPLQRKLAQVWFSSVGFKILVASDGAAALELARREHPNVIVSDVLMPGMDGFALCLSVRRDKELGKTPVILYSSAYIETSDQLFATRVGASALLSKTDTLEPITRAVAAALKSPPPAPLSEPVDLLEEEHTRRALWQLERQVQQNARLKQRSMLQEAQLAVLAGVTESLASNKVMNGVLGDVLAACLDMAGISKGVLYLTDAGQLRLEHQIGFSESEVPKLHDAFGCKDALANIVDRGIVVIAPSPAIPTELAQTLIVGAGVTALLLVPITRASAAYGLMVLGARTTDVTGEDALAFARALGAQMGQAIGLAHAFASLAASEQRYRALAENASDAICVLTTEGNISETNRRMTEILGYSAQQLSGRQLMDFATAGPGKKTMSGGTLPIGARTGPIEMRKADGGRVLMEFSTSVVPVNGQQLILAIGRDVTSPTP